MLLPQKEGNISSRMYNDEVQGLQLTGKFSARNVKEKS